MMVTGFHYLVADATDIDCRNLCNNPLQLNSSPNREIKILYKNRTIKQKWWMKFEHKNEINSVSNKQNNNKIFNRLASTASNITNSFGTITMNNCCKFNINWQKEL